MPHPIVADELTLLARVLAAVEKGPARAAPSEDAVRRELEHLRERLLSGRGAPESLERLAEEGDGAASPRRHRSCRTRWPAGDEVTIAVCEPPFGRLALHVWRHALRLARRLALHA